MPGHKLSASVSQNRKAELANAYNELGKELSSSKIRVVGNYTLGRVIGEGAYGKVRLGIHRLTSTRVAIKQIPKAMSASLTREIHHHRQLHHPHITQMYEVIATESHIWIVTELCCGGELFDYLVEKGRLSEEETRNLFGQLCLAVAYLHDNDIVHRDLKLENVLLDERCRVKLGDFGFTREFDRNALMETFCGTTGYASPEMLQGKKYQGPEVDVWSLGIILYTLLTGTLPFDDDDEAVMREKIIEGEFEDPAWLSLESRDLIKNILTKDVPKRITIPQMLTHPWFTSQTLSYEGEPLSPLPASVLDEFNRPSTPPQSDVELAQTQSRRNSNSEASTEDSTSTSPFSKQPDLINSTPTTPDKEYLVDPFESTDNKAQASPSSASQSSPSIPRHPSDSTIRKTTLESLSKLRRQSATVVEEEPPNETHAQGVKFPASGTAPSPIIYSASTSSKPSGPALPLRTPARTKRRSVSSVMSDGGAVTGSPTFDADNDNDLGIDMGVASGLSLNISAATSSQPIDFASLLTGHMPVMFSTEPERRLLNSLAALGLDTAQIVHSVLSHACDSAGAMWWMLRRKDREREETGAVWVASPAEEVKAFTFGLPEDKDKDKEKDKGKEREHKKKRHKVSAGVQTDSQVVAPLPPPPQFALVPPTPTINSARPTTPPPRERVGTPTKMSMLTPGSTTSAIPNGHGGDTSGSGSYRSYPSTPSGSVKDREKDNGHGKDREKEKGGRKARSGSVSIMQRATTALEAAGLVRKKSAEAVKEERDKDKDREKSKEAEREKEKRIGSNEEPRPSHGSTSGGSSKLTKSPPLKPTKDPIPIPSTPPPNEHSHITGTQIGSPWVLADTGISVPAEVAREAALATLTGAHTTANSLPINRDPMVHSYSTPNISDNVTRKPSPQPPIRNKSNLLAAFRLWFNEERKGKRKEDPNAGSHAGTSQAHAIGSIRVPSRRGSVSKPQTGVNNKNKGGNKYSSQRGTKHRGKRPSMSSRRSSSVNSRRSSVTSNHVAPLLELDSPQQIPRRSMGSHTPNSEFGGEHSSRPSSIHSLSMQPSTAASGRHKKSPSQSSTGSVHHFRTSSPMQKLYHRRGGSGSSTTRVVRQMTPVKEQRPPHVRSNSATSSLYSPPSSRPTSFYEQSESEGGGLNRPRTASPYRSRRKSMDETSSIASNSRKNGASGSGPTTFVAQKRQGPFASPAGIGRSSWKKSWGIEPPGWSSRTAHLPIEVIDILPLSNNEPISIRDVFSGKHPVHLTTVGAGDDSDWVDEDDDIPALAGGLGQMGALSMSSSVSSSAGSTGLNLPPLPPLQMDQGPITLSPAPRGHRTKRSGSGGNGGSGSRSKGGHSPSPKLSPLPSESLYDTAETRSGRRQLPSGRPGPAFKQAIQEEDEGEEE
ncbi:hypothetical protein CPB83DRAFT_793652 [Crepidotus variabilis]|uniref:Protein kinase domain-containing protein n=1 Tax=Crepidotus variabilis TaxID=179855 RepID=A0A9P6JNW0_9AGAR|nr:hypothetical protein CPB83DRAFT_793652 [Crepidotus variabilis]